MTRSALLCVLCAAGFLANSALAQDSGVIDDSEVEDRVQEAIEQAADEIATDLDVDSLVESDLGGLDTADLSSEVDTANQFDSADASVSLEFQASDSGGPVRRGSARDPNRRVNDLLFSASPKTRAAGARALANLNSLVSVGPLVLALADADASVRTAAANALGKLGEFEALGALKRAVPRERDPKVARAMDKAMGSIEDRVFSGPGAGEPITLTCSDGRKFVLLRKVPRGFCPYDGTPWTLQ